MRYFIHMGLDNEVGALNFKDLFLRDPPQSYVKNASAALRDDSPLYVHLGKDASGQGVVSSAVFSHQKALQQPAWSFARKIAQAEYFEV
jgi:hypothetical protein